MDQSYAGGSPFCVHLYVSGIVQGVFFRAHTTRIARALGLTGWVRNLDDGRVEIKAQGARKSIDEFIAWCRHGPPAASVESVDIAWIKPASDMEDFRTRR